MIKFEDVSCRYGKATPVFEHQSFSIPDNSTTILLGANGSGKTTLLKCITNQLHPYAGSISINSTPLKQISARDIAKLIAYVPQGLDQNVDYSVLDFITFGRTPHLGLLEMPSEKDYAIAKKYAERNGILHLVNQNVNEISGGERQLVYITRALVQETPIIIMDEPMSALDFANQANILKAVSELSEHGKTVLITSHNPNHALAISSHVLLIDRKRTIHWGKAEEILTNHNTLLQTFGPQVRCVKTDNFNYVVFSLPNTAASAY